MPEKGMTEPRHADDGFLFTDHMPKGTCQEWTAYHMMSHGLTDGYWMMSHRVARV